MQRIRDELRRAGHPVLALVTAFLAGAVVIVLTDFEHLAAFQGDPLGALGGAVGGMLHGYAAMFSGAIGNPDRIVTALESGTAADVAAAVRPMAETIVGATPFIFAGLGLAVSFQAGLFNLGVGGQFLVGGLGAAIAAALVAGLMPPLHALAVALLGGAIAGGAYGFVPGLLKARTGAHEVITTLMLNGIAPNLVFLVAGMVALPGPSPAIPAVPRLSDLPMVRVDWGFIVALALAPVVSALLFRSTLGFELRAAGFSPTVARAAGVRSGRTTMLAMSLSGGLVGLGSAFYGLGPAWGTGGGAPWDLGYVAIALTLLGGRRPGGVVVTALLYGALTTGGKSMVTATGIPLTLLTVIAAIAIMLVAAPQLTHSIWRLRPPEPGSHRDPGVGL